MIVAQRQDGAWFNPVRVRPMSKDQVTELEWLGRVNDTGLGATYADSDGRAYTSTLGAEVLRIYEAPRLPNWSEGTIRRYWEVPTYEPTAARWGSERSEFPC